MNTTQNAIAAAIANQAGSNVVLNDNVESAVAASSTPATAPVSAVSISKLIAARKEWEVGVYRTSNLALYAILASSLQFYNELAALHYKHADRVAFTEFCTKLGLKFKSDTQLISKVVKCVFYDEAADRNAQRDRRRISAYATVLRRAVSDNIAPADLSAWIETNGGVEQIRLAKGTLISAATKAAQAKDVVESGDGYITVVQNDILNAKFGVDDYDQARVVIVVPRKDGKVEIRAVVKSAGAVNASLAAIYKDAVAANSNAAVSAPAAELAAA